MDLPALRHPLAELRISAGHSQTAYAGLVAAAHAALGFGTMAARREKVSRWESGRVEPELSAQFAMAHIHQVPREEVLRRGWPGWLPTGGRGRTALLEQPWTGDQAVRMLSAMADRPPAGQRGRGFLTVATDADVNRLARAWPSPPAAHAPDRFTARGGHGLRIGRETVTALEHKHAAAQQIWADLGPTVALPVLHADLQLVAMLCRDARCDGPVFSRLLAVAANVACLSGWLSFETGDHGRAEALYVTAVRLAAAAADGQIGAYAYVLLAKQRIELADPRRALTLLDAAADTAGQARPLPPLSALIASTRATAHALLGEPELFERETDLAFGHVAGVLTSEDGSLFTHWITEKQILCMAASAAVDLGQMDRALHWSAPLLDARAARSLPRRENAYLLSHLGRAFAALGDRDAALRCADDVEDFLAGRTSHGISLYHSRLAYALAE